MAIKPNWYVSCSPRSPEKIQPELAVLFKYQGQLWRGNNSGAQENFAKDLASLDTFKGETFEYEKSFSARDRVAPMKTYGFIFINKSGELQFTKAGLMLKENKRPKDIFLKQLIKWQYPSVQHKGSQYPASTWHLNPFIFILKLIKKINGITKLELAIFGLTVTHNNEVDKISTEILQFRSDLSKIDGSNTREEFIDNYFFNKYKNKFGSITTVREGKSASNNKSAIKTKMRNARDVADATFRYFRYTGLFNSRGNRLTLNNDRIEEINEIISLNYFNPNYKNATLFHKEYGDPSFPQLSFETTNILCNKIQKYHHHNLDIIDSIISEFPNVYIEKNKLSKLISCLSTADLESLKDILYEEREIQIELKKKLLQIKFKDPEEIQKHIDLLNLYYKKNSDIMAIIGENFIANKNTVLEYLALNSFIILGQANNYINNYTIDEDLQPISHASGNKSDIEIEYNNFIILGEVTTSKGATQFKMEGEPVTRHYINKKRYLSNNNSNKELYCVFIAPKLNNNTLDEFSIYNSNWDTKIIPFTLKQFTKIITTKRELIINSKPFNIKYFRDLLDTLCSLTLSSCSENLEKNLDNAINIWCKSIIGGVKNE